MNKYVARLISWNSFCLDKNILFSEGYICFDNEQISFNFLNKNDKYSFFEFDYDKEVLGHDIYLLLDNKRFEIDINFICLDKTFDDLYFYNENDLGAIYKKEYTTFKIWLPLASKINVLIDDKRYEMKRLDKGVFSCVVSKDLDGASYLYEVFINSKIITITDPYGFSALSNHKKSAVVDLSKLNEIDDYDSLLPNIKPIESTIYELNVRDFTIDENTSIINKGKYLGLCEENATTKNNHPAGLSYLKMLGFSHIQLMPVLDFKTVDENNPNDKYNWGYDPISFFTLEGSYSLAPDDPYSRMIEFKQLVSSFHKNKMRVVLDVVYNHIYDVKNTNFGKIMPLYYFRCDENGDFLDHSYCGNEFASERKMVQKLMLDSISFLLTNYHVDGFRFDLMGLLDVNTMNKISSLAKSIKSDVMLYGEGWNMADYTFDNSKLSTIENSSLLPDYSFFNDRYRNIVRGHGDKAKLYENGYLLGNLDYKYGFEFAYLGTCVDITYPKLFNKFSKSINYVECHDNATLFDIIKYSTNISDIYRQIKKINKLLSLSFGIPFFHQGQEIGLSKHKHHNTYNEGDKYNKFSYLQLDKNFDMANSISYYLKLRKSISLFSIDDPNKIIDRIDYKYHGDVLDITLYDFDKTLHLLINETDKGHCLKLDKKVKFYILKEYQKNDLNIEFESINLSPFQVSIFVEVEN